VKCAQDLSHYQICKYDDTIRHILLFANFTVAVMLCAFLAPIWCGCSLLLLVYQLDAKKRKKERKKKKKRKAIWLLA